MTRSYWFTSDDLGECRLSKFEADKFGTVTVRGAEPDVPHDGVWIDGERSPDTYVFVDDEQAYHSPDERLGRWSFDKHEDRGGGHPLMLTPCVQPSIEL